MTSVGNRPARRRPVKSNCTIYTWDPPHIKTGGGAQVTTDKYTVYKFILYTGAAPGFWFEGGTGKNFIHEFLSSPILQWRRQILVRGGHSAQMYSSKTFEK